VQAINQSKKYQTGGRFVCLLNYHIQWSRRTCASMKLVSSNYSHQEETCIHDINQRRRN
jgi:hypothetical protein